MSFSNSGSWYIANFLYDDDDSSSDGDYSDDELNTQSMLGLDLIEEEPKNGKTVFLNGIDYSSPDLDTEESMKRDANISW